MKMEIDYGNPWMRGFSAEALPSSVITALEAIHHLSTEDIETAWHISSQHRLTGVILPQEAGGSGLSYLQYLRLLRSIAEWSGSFAVMLSVHISVGAYPLLSYGTVAQQAEWLPRLACGDTMAAFALTEANAGSDASQGRLKAQSLSNGDYCLNGAKIFITNALTAGLFVVIARTSIEGPKGLTVFLIPSDVSGFSVLPGDEKLGLQQSNWGTLQFDDCIIPGSWRLGDKGQGFRIAMDGLEGGRIGIGAISLGLADRCLGYAKTRQLSGVADMATRLAAAEQLVAHAGWLKQRGVPCSREASMAKLVSSETATAIAQQTLTDLGFLAYHADHPVAEALCDAKAMEIVEGTNQVQHLLIAKQLLK